MQVRCFSERSEGADDYEDSAFQHGDCEQESTQQAADHRNHKAARCGPTGHSADHCSDDRLRPTHRPGHHHLAGRPR